MATRKNLHQTHLEDLVLLGRDGIDELNNHILNFARRLSGKDGAVLTTKIDGAPALICGHNIKGYPETFVGIKSVLNSPKNAYSTPEQIDEKFGDRPSIANKMKYALILAKSIPNGEAWQGDCLFSGNPDVQEINGKHYVTFQPNKILYAFPEDNAGYEKIQNSIFGIAFHTRYVRSGDGWKQSFNVDPEELTDVPDKFYVMSPALKMNAASDYDMKALNEKIKELGALEKDLLADPAYEELINNDVFISYWNTFENKFISDKKVTKLDLNSFFEDLKDYIANVQKNEYDKRMLTLKTERGRTKATERYNKDVEEMKVLLDDHKDTLVKLVKTINCASEVKMLMLAGLKKIKQDYSTFATTADSIEEVGDEGIAMSDADGNIVKLVDRSEFSNINRDPRYLAGFQHEALEEDKNANDRQIYNLVYDKLLDIAEDARLKHKDNHKHYETIRGYLKKQYRGNKLSRTMFTKLSKLVDSYDKKRESLVYNAGDKYYNANMENKINEEKHTQAWMLRHDGEEFEVDMHYVLFDLDRVKKYLILGGRYNKSLEWYYNHTSSDQVKNDIAILFRCIKDQGGRVGETSVDYANAKVSEKDVPYFDDDVEKLYRGIFIEYCNEFCKVRYGGQYADHEDGICYFRIASLHKNWYDPIWKFVMNHKSITKYITVCSDEEVTGYFNYKELNGKEIDEMPREEFLTAKGNPVVEKFKTVREHYGVGHISRVIEHFYNCINEEVDLSEKIVKKGSQWQVQSEKGRNMGTYDTKAEAEKRLKQVHYFKYKNEDLSSFGEIDD